MKTIQLTRGFVTTVDDEDFERLAQWRWHANCDGYATRKQWIPDKKTCKAVFMHHEILGRREGFQVDHRNGDRRDNRRENLRFATHTENARNQKVRKDSELGVKGVKFRNGRFEAHIFIEGKRKMLGRFDSLEEAKFAYDGKAAELHGAFFRS